MKLIIFILFCSASWCYSQSIDSTFLNNKDNWDVFNDQSRVMEPSESSGGVNDIWVENDSNYWIATGGPTYHVVNNQWRNQHVNSPIEDSVGYNVNQIFFSPFSSQLWFGSNYTGITSHKDSIWKKRITSPLTNYSSVNLVIEDKENNVLVWGTRFVNGRNKFYRISERFILNSEANVIRYQSPIKNESQTVPNINNMGYMTVLSEDSKFLYKNGKWKKSKLPGRIEIGPTVSTHTLKTLFTETGDIWIYRAKFGGQQAKFIQIKKHKIVEHKVHPEMNSSIGLGKIQIDSEGRIWICLRSSGYWVYDGENWTNINSLNSPLEGNNYETICIFNKKIWFGTNRGVFVYHPPFE